MSGTDADVTEAQLNEVMDGLFSDIVESRTEGCFQRILCEMSAQPAEFKQVAMVRGVEMSENMPLGPRALRAAAQLRAAINMGRDFQRSAVGYEYCEKVYNQCLWSGKQIDYIISEHRQA